MSEETGRRGDGLTEIAVQPPPFLAEMLGYPGAYRYVALYYMGTCATWDDGLASATFSYFGVFRPLTEHPVLAIHLLGADLGSDDTEPTHALVCDLEGGKFLLGRYEDAMRLVRGQVSDVDRAEAGARYATLFGEPKALEDLPVVGMFELFIAPPAAFRERTQELLHHLDLQITEALIRRYIDLSKGERQYEVYGALRYLHDLIERAKGAREGAA